MAAMDLRNLSSNWKSLQAKLKPGTTPATSKHDRSKDDRQPILKRKRNQNANGHTTFASGRTLNGTARTSRKRQKMEEPVSVGASIKQHDGRALSRSISMPSLTKKLLLSSPKAASQAVSVLEPHPDFPDIENEGVSESALPGKYVALDCEMVGVGPEPDRDSALARVSLVNFHGHQVYDSYVQMPPKVEVTDYRTAVSGIEPRHLRPDVARPFNEVRSDLQTLLGGRILVGHAVKNDLKVLILKHNRPFIRDTSKFSKFRAQAMTPGRTPGLKWLAEKLLGVEIQVGAHSSVEDARATMALYRLDKDDFEQEIRQLYGHIRLEAAGPEVDIGSGDEVKKKSRNRKKKKKKH